MNIGGSSGSGRSFQVTVCFVAFCTVQLALLAYFRAGSSGFGGWQNNNDEWHQRFTSIIKSHVTHNEFGEVARQVAETARLVEQQVSNPSSVDPAILELAVTKLFPWWRAETLGYYPWKRNTTTVPVSQQTGVLICTGNKNVILTAHLIVTLRYVLNSTLPIEICFAGDNDLSPRWRRFLLDQVGNKDIHTLDLTQIYDNQLLDLRTWDIKPFGIVASRFTRTILMDADAFFFSSPDNLFEDHPGLKETGTLFLRDRSKFWDDGRRKSPRQRLEWLSEQIATAGRKPSRFLTHQSLLWAGDSMVTEVMDSCTVMVDKSRPGIYMAMLFAAWMNGAGPRSTFYQYWHGDKESYWIASELTGVPFYFEPWTSVRMAVAPDMKSKTFDAEAELKAQCTHHMVHANADGTAPLLGNGAIMNNPGNPNEGTVGFTHFYLAHPIDEALVDIKRNLSLPADTDWRTKMDSETEHYYHKYMLASQVNWNGPCTQGSPERWRPIVGEAEANLEKSREIVKPVAMNFEAVQEELRKFPERINDELHGSRLVVEYDGYTGADEVHDN